ncbi:hypothetical protein GWK47_046790 [Chionoecetes opilio]|uniref:Uncharacterized protein n=1 Tax=Chionoecetes opilio TaxID=41210 RepID=A0A8J5CUQ8_CHIOP|nr:hypothetical protein GWK47_046790 [Chionoecetes opilio]
MPNPALGIRCHRRYKPGRMMLASDALSTGPPADRGVPVPMNMEVRVDLLHFSPERLEDYGAQQQVTRGIERQPHSSNSAIRSSQGRPHITLPPNTALPDTATSHPPRIRNTDHLVMAQRSSFDTQHRYLVMGQRNTENPSTTQQQQKQPPTTPPLKHSADTAQHPTALTKMLT